MLLAHVACFLYLQDGRTPLYCAAQKGHDKIMEMLVQAGADVNAANKVGMISLCTSVRVRRIAIVNCKIAPALTL
jgi:ankyrin repeat protein